MLTTRIRLIGLGMVTGLLFSILSPEGERLAQWGNEVHRSCHGVWADSHKDLYFVMPGEWRPRRVVKFTRK